jgi:hypothetical protein
MAVAHSVLVIADHVLDRGVAYQELGDDYFQQRQLVRQFRMRSQVQVLAGSPAIPQLTATRPIIGAGLSGRVAGFVPPACHSERPDRMGAWRSLMRQGLSEGSDGVKAVVVPVAGHHGIA